MSGVPITLPLIPAIKAAVARQHGDSGYARVRPPLIPTGSAHEAEVDEAVRIVTSAQTVPAQ